MSNHADGQRPECFVIMPISDQRDYPPGHFKRVYDDILAPACVAAGYEPKRADQVKETNLIHLDILGRLLQSPMVLCDLSARNPNVLFELGLRQAFDRPVALVRDDATEDIFDVQPLRSSRYRRARLYDEVLQDQGAIADALKATAAATEGANSLVRLLAIPSPATLPAVKSEASDPAFQLVRAEVAALRDELRTVLMAGWSEAQSRAGARLSGAHERPRVADLAKLERMMDRLERDRRAGSVGLNMYRSRLAEAATALATVQDGLLSTPSPSELAIFRDLVSRLDRLRSELAGRSSPPSEPIVLAAPPQELP